MTDLENYLKMVEPLEAHRYEVTVTKRTGYTGNNYTEVRVQVGMNYAAHTFDGSGKLHSVTGEDLWPSA